MQNFRTDLSADCPGKFLTINVVYFFVLLYRTYSDDQTVNKLLSNLFTALLLDKFDNDYCQKVSSGLRMCWKLNSFNTDFFLSEKTFEYCAPFGIPFALANWSALAVSSTDCIRGSPLLVFSGE